MKLPKNETARVSYKTGDTLVFLLTEIVGKGTFVLYEAADDGLKKLGKSASPTELEERYAVLERLAKTVRG